jgi:HSP20 family protein
MAQLPARRSGRTTALVSPFREFEDIYDRMGQLISAAFGDLPGDVGRGLPWAPLADISETDDAYMVEVEVPGLRKDDINIQIQDRELVVTGEISESEQGRLRKKTRRTGRFEFRAQLPGDINQEKVSAHLADGVLTITLPKSEAAKPRHIEVTA